MKGLAANAAHDCASKNPSIGRVGKMEYQHKLTIIMEKKRSGGMTTIAIINFVFGGWRALLSLGGLVAATSVMSNPSMTGAVGDKGAQLGALMLAGALLSLPLAGAAIVSGIGILRLAPWGRTWTLVYAILGIVIQLVLLGLTEAMREFDVNPAEPLNPILTFVLVFSYPILLLYLINTKTWKDAFAKTSTLLPDHQPNVNT